MTRGVKGSGLSLVETPNHKFKAAGKWFLTKEEADDYAWKDRVRKAARKAGWPYQTREDLQKFHDFREAHRAELRREKDRKAKDALERKRIRKRYGLHPTANLANMAAKLAGPQQEEDLVLGYRHRVNDRKLPDAEKLEVIRQMIEDRTPIMDFMIRVSNIVGADLKGKK